MKDFKVILFLGIVATICVMLLSGVDIASQRASAIFNRRLYQDILEKFEIPVKRGEIVEEKFAENFDVKTIGSTIYYISKEREKDAVIFKTYGPGLWGTIEVLLAVYPDFERLLWFKVLAQTETPGLGGRIAEEEFQARFNDVEIRPELKIVKFAAGPNQVDAVTGASITCRALEKLINKAIRELDQALGRENAS
jgi:Na+-transporting NADH:ubiquinone oxidoreductase subunit C